MHVDLHNSSQLLDDSIKQIRILTWGYKKGCKSRKYSIYNLSRGEGGSRTYTFKKYHKIANY